MEIISQAQAVNGEYQQFLKGKVSRLVGTQPERRPTSQFSKEPHAGIERTKFLGKREIRWNALSPFYPLFANAKQGRSTAPRSLFGLFLLVKCGGFGCVADSRLIERIATTFSLTSFHRPFQARKLLDNTLLDGELVFDKYENNTTKPRFLVFDLVVFEGQDMSQRPFTKRIGYFTENILKPLKRFQHETGKQPEMSVELKKMELSYGVPVVWASLKDLKHENDGLIFTDSDAPYTFGTCDWMIKWKPPHLNTIDFKLRYVSNTRLVLDILVRSGEYEEYSDFTPPDLSWYSRKEEFDGKIVECQYDPSKQNKWVFMRFREDKNTPNHVSVVPRILKSIAEGVKVDEVFNNLYSKKKIG